MEGVSADSQMEGVLARRLGNIFVSANTSGFQGLARQLLVLIGNEVSAERKFVNVGTFTSEVEDTDLGVRDTTVVTRFRVRLILAITVAASWAATHL